MLLNDAYAGHRKWWRRDWVEDPALASVWTEWDYILVRVHQYIEDYTSANGHLMWVEEDPDVDWDVDLSDSFYERKLHEYRESNDIQPWQHTRARIVLDPDAEPPSMEKWLKRLEEDADGGFDRPQGSRGRPPTAEELAALRSSERSA